MSYVHHTVLVVDSNPDDAHFSQFALQRVGVITPVQVVGSAEQAVCYLKGEGDYADRERWPLPVLLLLDLKLSGTSGLEFLGWLRRQPVLRRLPVVVLTSVRDPGEVNGAYDLGCNSYLFKPSSFNALLVLMQGVVHYWFTLNHGAELSLAAENLLPEQCGSGAVAEAP